MPEVTIVVTESSNAEHPGSPIPSATVTCADGDRFSANEQGEIEVSFREEGESATIGATGYDSVKVALAETPGKFRVSLGLDNGCFVATAAYGSALAPEVQELRELRDNVLRRMQWGHDFFADYWSYYYKFSPAIAQAMDADPRMRDVVRWSIVEPWTHFLRAVVNRPAWSSIDFEGLPPELSVFLNDLRSSMDSWIAQIEVPRSFSGKSNTSIVDELNVILTYIYRDGGCAYLDELVTGQVLPLRPSDDAERLALREALEQGGRTNREMELILA
jgi:hypothetical protein